MNRKTGLIAALAFVVALAAAGAASAQPLPHHGQGKHPHHQEMHEKMHGRNGMHHGSGHGAGHGAGHGGHGPQAAKGDRGPSSAAFAAANERMHRDMDIEFTGDADVDFARGMIPHHQGAIDMAKTVIAFGKDAEMRALAEAVVKAQEAEIAFMREWLKKRGL